MKIVRNLLILAILLLIIYSILKHYNILKLQKEQEGFTISTVWSDVSKFYGNCIYNNDNSNNNSILNISYNSPSVEIRLPGKCKITGFKVDLYNDNTLIIPDSNNLESNLKYSFSVGNDISSMVDVVNDYGFNKFKFNTDVKDIILFENDDGTSKYNGRNVTITLQNLKDKDNIENIDKTIKYKLKIKIFGLDVYALNAKTYGNYTASSYTISSDKTIILDTNKKIVAIDMLNNTSNDILKIVYDNKFDSNKRKYIGVGPINQGFDISNSKHNIIYFNKPIIASTVMFKKLNSSTSNIDINGNVNVYYSEVSRRDEINFKFDKQLENNDKLGIAIQGEKCPGINQIMRSQMQAQQLCEALEYKDRIRNSKVLYEKEKTYLKKLANQEKELQELEKLINDLVSRKNDRIKNNKYNSVEALDKELRKIEEIRKQAETDLLEDRKAHDLKVELNLEPEFTDILAKYNLE